VVAKIREHGVHHGGIERGRGVVVEVDGFHGLYSNGRIEVLAS
jgi:hypothetical protein